jgi:hypothetical protein
LHFALHVFIVFSNTKIPPKKKTPNTIKIQMSLAPLMPLSKSTPTLGNSQGFTLIPTFIYHKNKRALPGNL